MPSVVIFRFQPTLDVKSRRQKCPTNAYSSCAKRITVLWIIPKCSSCSEWCSASWLQRQTYELHATCPSMGRRFGLGNGPLTRYRTSSIPTWN